MENHCLCPALIDTAYKILQEKDAIRVNSKPSIEQTLSSSDAKSWLDSRLSQLSKDQRNRIRDLEVYYKINQKKVAIPLNIAKQTLKEAYKKFKIKARNTYLRTLRELEDDR